MSKQCKMCGDEIKGRRSDANYCLPCAHIRQLEARRRCYNKLYASPRPATQKACIVCGKTFDCPPSQQDRLQTCSPACKSINHRQKMSPERIATQEPLRIEGVHKSPKTGHFSTHIHAKRYRITLPDGTIYELRNLKLWHEENAHLLPVQIKSAYQGMLSACKQGRRWHGWIIECLEDND